MPSYRRAVRRTQREIDRGIDSAPQETFADMDYRGLQKVAIARGIAGNQSAEELRAALEAYKPEGDA